MIGICSRCGAGFDGSEEDVNSPGDDLQGPECPTCYARRKNMGINSDKANVSPIASLPKVAPTSGDVTVPGVSLSAVLPLVSSDAYDLAVLLVLTVPFVVVGLWAWWEEFRRPRRNEQQIDAHRAMKKGLRGAKRRGWLPEDDTQ